METVRDKNFAMKARVRELLDATLLRPLVIRLADGKEYRITHPDFVCSPPVAMRRRLRLKNRMGSARAVRPAIASVTAVENELSPA